MIIIKEGLDIIEVIDKNVVNDEDIGSVDIDYVRGIMGDDVNYFVLPNNLVVFTGRHAFDMDRNIKFVIKGVSSPVNMFSERDIILNGNIVIGRLYENDTVGLLSEEEVINIKSKIYSVVSDEGEVIFVYKLDASDMR